MKAAKATCLSCGRLWITLRERDPAAKRIEALEAALRQIATLEDLPSSLSVARSIARGAALAPEPEK